MKYKIKKSFNYTLDAKTSITAQVGEILDVPELMFLPLDCVEKIEDKKTKEVVIENNSIKPEDIKTTTTGEIKEDLNEKGEPNILDAQPGDPVLSDEEAAEVIRLTMADPRLNLDPEETADADETTKNIFGKKKKK
jgi:hypothetical protein